MSARFTQVGRARALGDVRRLDRSDRARQAARRPRRRGRRAASATSSSRCGTGPIRRSTCTTRSPPTSATRPSTPTGRSTARSKRAPTTCRSSIRRATRRRRSSCRCATRRRRARRTIRRRSRRPTGATKRSGRRRPRPTVSRWTSRRACGSPRASVRTQTPAFCQQGSSHPSAKAFPIAQSGRQMQLYDPKTKQVTTIDTCFGTHHLNFDNNGVLWFTGGGPVEGWFDTKVYDKTHDEQKAQGWTRVRPRHQRQRQARRLRRARSADRSDEGQAHQRAVLRRGAESGRRIDLGIGAGHARLARSPGAGTESAGDRALGSLRGARGTTRRRAGRDSRRAAWTWTATASSGPCCRADSWRASIAASARVRSTGRRPPASTVPKAGRSIRCRDRTTRARSTPASADSAYYNFVDRFDMLGLGKDIPLATGNESEGAARAGGREVHDLPRALSDGLLRKGIDGRIDDAKAGWKGKGIWTSVSTRAPFHMEGGRGTTSKLVKFQVRPDPLAEVEADQEIWNLRSASRLCRAIFLASDLM